MMGSPHSIEDEAVATEAVDMATLLTENKALQQENKSLHDRLLRALADAENVRRQAERSAADARQYAIADFTRELLTVVDNLQRTVEAADDPTVLSRAEDAALLEGVIATLRAFLQTLERFGVRPIDALGKPFDPNLHEAMLEVDDPSRPPGTVAHVLEQGYTIRDRLLRPARVAVTRSPGGSSAPLDEREGDLGSMWAPPV